VTIPPDSSGRYEVQGGDETADTSSPASSEEMISDVWAQYEPTEPSDYLAQAASPDEEDEADPLADLDAETGVDSDAQADAGTAVEGDTDAVAHSLPADPFADTGASAAGRREGDAEESIEVLRTRSEESERKKASRRSFWKELPILILVALVVAILIKTFLVQVFSIPSGSMEPTLRPGDRVMVNKLAYRFGEPARGDLVVFQNPLVPSDDGSIVGSVVRHVAESLGISSPDDALIKRIVALEGETLEMVDGDLFVDGVQIDEPYIADENWDNTDFGPITVPADHVFVMGDNRRNSKDGRVFGPVAENTIVGRAFVIVWPRSRWGGL